MSHRAPAWARRAAILASAALATGAASLSCGGASAAHGGASSKAPRHDASKADGDSGAASVAAASSDAWPEATRSPTPIAHADLDEMDALLLARCGASDAALTAVAREIVARGKSGAPLDAVSLDEALRAAGEPHVAPRAAIFRGSAGDPASLLAKLGAWSASLPVSGERRCGVARAEGEGGEGTVAAVAVDALADLAPLPTRAHPGTWLTVEAQLLVPADAARVVVAGPDGAPRTVPASFADRRVRARFAPDRPGAFVVQVVADVDGGPRPVLEARVFADAPPARTTAPAPGEDAAAPSARPDDALAAMALSLRRSLALPPLERDARLDAIALAHATAMRRARAVVHDAGDGDPTRRVQSAGLSPAVVGENVAHAEAAALAHRALYASPSHRANLLRPGFRKIGVAAVAGDGDGIWVVELFTSDLP